MDNHWNVLRNSLLCEQKVLPILPRFHARLTCVLISKLHSCTIVGEFGPLDVVTAIEHLSDALGQPRAESNPAAPKILRFHTQYGLPRHGANRAPSVALEAGQVRREGRGRPGDGGEGAEEMQLEEVKEAAIVRGQAFVRLGLAHCR